MGSEDTPTPGRPLETGGMTDKFNLMRLVTRLEAQITTLKEEIDCLNERDSKQDERIAKLEDNMGKLIAAQKDLLEKIHAAQTRSEQADMGHASRLQTIERRVGGIGSVLILLQGGLEIWKAAHGH